MSPDGPGGLLPPRLALRLLNDAFRLLFRLLYGEVRIRVTREVWGNGEPYYLAAMPSTSAHGIGPTVEHAIGQLVNDWGRQLLGLTIDRPR